MTDGDMNVPSLDELMKDPEAVDRAMERLVDVLKAHKRLEAMTAQELVNLALEHLDGLGAIKNLIVEELCTRVYPNWSNEDPVPDEPPEPDGECFRGGEAAAYLADQQAAAQRLK